MDNATAQRLCALNRRFYDRVHQSFSSTRTKPWPGWERVLGHMPLPGRGRSLRLCDAACGNGRFAVLAAQGLQGVPLDVTCIDGNSELLQRAAEALGGTVASLRLAQQDLLADILGEEACPKEPSPLGGAPFDAAVAFGFLHHVPGSRQRVRFMERLLESLRPGGVACVSLWRFTDDPGLRSKALATTAAAPELLRDALEQGDYLLGWQGSPEHLRYCHSFSTEEVDGLARALDPLAQVRDRFRSDGRTGALNEYLVLERRADR